MTTDHEQAPLELAEGEWRLERIEGKLTAPNATVIGLNDARWLVAALKAMHAPNYLGRSLFDRFKDDIAVRKELAATKKALEAEREDLRQLREWSDGHVEAQRLLRADLARVEAERAEAQKHMIGRGELLEREMQETQRLQACIAELEADKQAWLTENTSLLTRIAELEGCLRELHDKADDVNAAHGRAYGERKATVCVFCGADSYNGEVGIIHDERCVILRARAVLEAKK